MLRQETGIRPADIGRRAIALVIDTLVFLALLVIFAFCLAFALLAAGQNERAVEEMTGPLSIFLLILYFAYFIYMEARWGQTIGKRVMKLRVVTTEGAPIGWRESIIRNLFRGLDGLFYYLVGLLVAVLSSRNQRIGDHVANTLVVPIEVVQQPQDPDIV